MDFRQKRLLEQLHLERVRRDNDRLNEKNEALRSFTGGVSHDLKSPVRELGVSCALIERKIDDRDDVLRRLSKMQATAANLTQLIDAFLEFSQTGYRKPGIANRVLRTNGSTVLGD